MVDDLVRDGHDVPGGDEERTSPKPEVVRLAMTSPVEARKGT
jgi:hypothetical protein